MNERPVPEAALLDENSVEMLRVWIAGRQLHTSMKAGMYRKASTVPEEKAWGRILADVARHLANALEEGYAANYGKVLALIRATFNAELDAPTTRAEGGFVKRH